MTPTEVTKLCALLAARCPQQRFEDGTPDAWHADLKDVPLADATEAVRRVTTRQPFCALSDLLTEIRALRNERATARHHEQLAAELDQLRGSGQPMPTELRDQMTDAFAVPKMRPHPQPDAADRAAALTVACPWCGVGPQRGCESQVDRRLMPVPHPSRVEAGRSRRKEPAS